MKIYSIKPAKPPRRPRMDWDDDVSLLPALTVYEPDYEDEDTGLVDKYGNTIVSRYEKERIGF